MRAFPNNREHGISRGITSRLESPRSSLDGDSRAIMAARLIPRSRKRRRGAPTSAATPATGYPEMGVVRKNTRIFSSTAALDGLNHNK